MAEASHVNVKEERSDEEIELSLGLSSNGRFGMDPNRNAKKLKRSSSISNLFFTVDAGGSGVNRASWVALGENALLTRTSSLPADPPEEWRGRKERMEARKNRMEKMKSVRNGKDKESVVDEENWLKRCNKVEIGSSSSKGSVNGIIPAFQSQHAEANGMVELKRTSSITRLPDPTSQKTVIGSIATLTDDAKDPIMRNVLLDMPLVSTRGSDPNGTKVEGFLYRYRKGDEVRIVCVCHGNFYSPTEFVAHAGGGHIEHPLRNITVNTSPFVL